MSDNQELEPSGEKQYIKKKNHRGWKITLISLGSLLGLVVVAVCVACWIIFTHSRLTGIVNKLSGKFLTCQSSFAKVDLTLFKTFPNVGLDVHDVLLVNPVAGADKTLWPRHRRRGGGHNLRFPQRQCNYREQGENE